MGLASLQNVFHCIGGPGGFGVSFAMSSGKAFSKMLGEQYDLIGFDPRGIGMTKSAM